MGCGRGLVNLVQRRVEQTTEAFGRAAWSPVAPQPAAGLGAVKDKP